MSRARLPSCGQNLRAASGLSDTLSLMAFLLSFDWLILSACEKAGGATVSSVVLLCEKTVDWQPSCHPNLCSSFLVRRQSPKHGWSVDGRSGALPEPQTDSRTHQPVSQCEPV